VQHVEIRVQECLDDYWTDWFGGLRITHRDQDGTVLAGEVIDQAALYAVLSGLRDAGLTLVEVRSGGQDSTGTHSRGR